MEQSPYPERRPLRFVVAITVLLAVAVAAAQGPSLAGLLPRESVLALGVRDLATHEAKFQPFLDEAERLGLDEHVRALLGEEIPEDAPEVPQVVQDLGPLDVLGQEAWLSVSISEFNPLPAVTVAFVPRGGAAEAVAQLIEQAPQSEQMDEGGMPFHVLPVSPDLPPMAVANVDGLVAASSQPEVLRGVLRRHAGAGEPSLRDADVWTQALAPLGEEGNAYALLDLAPALPALLPMAQGMVPPPVLERLEGAVRTIGPGAQVSSFTDAGLSTASRQAPNAEADAELHDLLTSPQAATRAPLEFLPEGALSLGTNTVDLDAWWDWIGGLLASLPAEMQVPELDELSQMLGVDVRAQLLSWSGDQFVTIVTAPPTVAEPGNVQGALLGEQVMMLESTDDAAAFEGLRTLLQTLGMQASAMADPSGQPQARMETRTVAGVEVARMQVQENVAVSVAATDGFALLAGSDDAMEAVLNARAEGDGAPEAFAGLAEEVPQSARAYSLSDDRRAVEGSVDALVSQLQLAAGMAGAGQLDFEAVEAASEALAEFAGFVAERVGGSHSVTVVEDGALVGKGLSRIDW